MAKADPELILDVNQLSETTTFPQTEQEPPQQLPKHLADFKQYADSKFCYYSKPVDSAEMINVQPKIAFQCQMTILMETRELRMEVTPHPWETESVLGSTTLGRFLESTERSGESVGDIWNDYQVDVPSHDNKLKQVFSLANSAFYTRCTKCRAKGYVSCSSCNGSGTINNRSQVCSECKGAGKVICSKCNSLGGFRHLPTLRVKWFPRLSTWFYQNSFLHEKRISKGKRTCIWSLKQEPWSKDASIEYYVQSINDEIPDIPLKINIIKDYNEKHLIPTRDLNNRMRRLECSIERMDFEEIQYTMGENYANKQDPTKGNTFQFCQYPGSEGQKLIYEEDYPLNCCGCFGERLACYSSCCNIL